jgi:hypothetical protein
VKGQKPEFAVALFALIVIGVAAAVLAAYFMEVVVS